MPSDLSHPLSHVTNLRLSHVAAPYRGATVTKSLPKLTRPAMPRFSHPAVLSQSIRHPHKEARLPTLTNESENEEASPRPAHQLLNR
jgi:hypothetical protein